MMSFKSTRVAVSVVSIMFTMALIGCFSAPVHAQMRFGIQGSYADDMDFGVGARAVFDLSNVSRGLQGIGSFDYFFPGENWTYFEINGNVAYTFSLQQQNFAPYVGGGIHVARISFDGRVLEISDTKVGGNLLGGVKIGSNIFIEARVEMGGGEQFVITGGFLF